MAGALLPLFLMVSVPLSGYRPGWALLLLASFVPIALILDPRPRLWARARMHARRTGYQAPPFDDVGEELRRLYAAAMTQDRQAYDALVAHTNLRGIDLRKDFGPVQLLILYDAMRHTGLAHASARDRDTLIRRAMATPSVFSQLIDPETAAALLGMDRPQATLRITGLQDHLEYADRYMPTITGLTGYFLSRSSPSSKPWTERIDDTIAGYQRYLQPRIGS